MLVLKQNKGNNLDSCKSMISLKESYSIWKNKSQNSNNFCLQRFIIPQDNLVCKTRVLYSIQKNQILSRTLSNELTELHVPRVGRNGWVRLNSLSNAKKLSTEELYLVKGSEEADANYDNEVWDPNLIEQIKSIRKIIELDECSDGSYLLNEIIVDFIHNKHKEWFFLNVVSYKTEFIITKKSNSKLPKKRKLLNTRKTICKSVPNLDQFKSFNNSFYRKENLAQEALQALELPQQPIIYAADELYRRAYHLKPKRSMIKEEYLNYIN